MDNLTTLAKALVEKDFSAVQFLLQDDKLDIHFLFPSTTEPLTSAVALAFDCESQDILDLFLKRPHFDFSRPVAKVDLKERAKLLNLNTKLYLSVLGYAIYKKHFELAALVLNLGGKLESVEETLVSLRIALENDSHLLQEILRYHSEFLSSFDLKDKIAVMDVFQSHRSLLDTVFDILFTDLKDAPVEAIEWAYKCNISQEWLANLQSKRMNMDLNVRLSNGKTPIMVAAEHSMQEAKLLADLGADIYAKDTFGLGLICYTSSNISVFLDTFVVNEEQLTDLFMIKKRVSLLKIVEAVLNKYPDFDELITLDNIVIKPLLNDGFVDLQLVCRFKELLGIVENSNILLDILKNQVKDEPAETCYYKFKEVVEVLATAFGSPFNTLLQDNLRALAKWAAASARPTIIYYLLEEFNLDPKFVDESERSLLMMMLAVENEPICDQFKGHNLLVRNVDAKYRNTRGNILHQPDLKFTEFNVNLIRDVCAAKNVRFLEPSPLTGETLIDRFLKQKHVPERTGSTLYSVLFEEIFRSQYKLSVENFFALLEDTLDPEVLYFAVKVAAPENFLSPERRDGKSITERLILNSSLRKYPTLFRDHVKYFAPHVQLIVSTGDQEFIAYCLQLFFSKGYSKEIIPLLDDASIISKIDPETLIKAVLGSKDEAGIKFLIEKYDFSPNMLVDDMFPLYYVVCHDGCEQIFNYLTDKDAIYNVYPQSALHSNPQRFLWNRRLLAAGYGLTPENVSFMKADLRSYAELPIELRHDASLLCKISANPKLKHVFNAQDRSRCLIFSSSEPFLKELIEAGADPRLVITSKGESALHLNQSYISCAFWQTLKTTCNLTPQDFTSPGEASYSPLEAIFKNWPNPELHPIFEIFPELLDHQK